VVASALLALTLGGCLAASSSSSYETGRQVTSATLDKIKIGVTTENWLIGALGEPTSRQLVAEGEAISDERSAMSEEEVISDEVSPAEEGAQETEAAEGDASSVPGLHSTSGRVEILRYDWSRREESGGAFFLVFAGSETRTERSSAWFEVTDGIVTDFGVE
jgi:hypothetical protein